MKLSGFLLLSCLAAVARSVENTCGGTYRGFQYTITSPNYPNDYPIRTECIYRLQAEPTPDCEQQFHLQFLDFNLKASEGCNGDYLQVGDRNIYCGNTVGLRKFTGTNNTLVVSFHSDEKDTAKGFKILVSALPCSLKLSPLKNSLHSAFTGLPENSLSNLKAHNAESASYRHGMKGVNEAEDNNSATRISLHLPNDFRSSIRRPQIDSATENNPIINDDSNDDYRHNVLGPRITSYLFLPPKETNANVTLHREQGPSISDVIQSLKAGVTLPTSDLLPPSVNSVSTFSKDTKSTLDKKIGVPTRNDGDQDGLGFVDYEFQAGSDCDKNTQVSLPNGVSSDRINYDPIQSTAGYGAFSSPSKLVYDPKYNGFVGPSYNPGGNGAGYYPSNAGYPGGQYPNRPLDYPTGIIGSGYNPNNVGVSVPNYPSNSYDPIAGAYPSYPNYEPVNPNNNPLIGDGGYQGFSSVSPGFIGPGAECCRVPSTRRFSIVSPGFPGAMPPNNPYSCRYTIVKSSPDVCRLRLNFRYFNFGADNSDPYCSLGYVDVDGQRFCGCRTGQNLQLLFTDYSAKTISIFSAGYPRSKLAGFLIDIVQESCGIHGSYPGYNPAYPTYNPVHSGYIQRRSANESTSFVPSPVDPNPLIRNKRDLGYSYPKPHVSFLNNDVGFIPSMIKDQTHERFFTGSCQNRVLFDWVIASKEALFANARCVAGYGGGIPNFGARLTRSHLSSDEDSTETTCLEVNDDQGEIKSPLYPDNYPSNVNKCYRFIKAPNFCKLEVYVRDFDLESSQGCTTDYLSFSVEPKKYCGRSLKDFRKVFDLTQTNSLEVDFVSDDLGTGRGFDIGFAQLPCE